MTCLPEKLDDENKEGTKTKREDVEKRGVKMKWLEIETEIKEEVEEIYYDSSSDKGIILIRRLAMF